MSIDILCAGTLTVDERFVETAGEKEPRLPLRFVTESPHFLPGGMTITARALNSLGQRVGVLGCIGNDMPGLALRALLEREGINTQGVQPSVTSTGFSRIALTADQRWVEHSIGANAEFACDAALRHLLSNSGARLCAVGYGGLLPALDANEGEGMTELLRSARDNGMLTSLDIHTVEDGTCPFLDRPLPEADIFLCNAEEAFSLTGSTDKSALDKLWKRLTVNGRDRSRLAGITYAEAPLIRYGKKSAHRTIRIPNPWFGSFVPTDLTGAGDCFRAGLYAGILEQSEAFQIDELDVNRAILMACCAATRALRAATPCAVGPRNEMNKDAESMESAHCAANERLYGGCDFIRQAGIEPKGYAGTIEAAKRILKMKR